MPVVESIVTGKCEGVLLVPHGPLPDASMLVRAFQSIRPRTFLKV